jgi:hypothetical protein
MILSIIEGHLITLHKYFNPLSHPSTLVIVPHTWVGRCNHIGPFGACDFGWVVHYHGGWRLRTPNLKVKKEKKGFNGVQEVQCELMPSWLLAFYSIESFPKLYQVMMNQFDNEYHGVIRHRIWKLTYY